MTDDATAKAIADRMTLEKLAANVKELLALKDQQQMTQAQLIRWALRAMHAPLPPMNRGHINSMADWRKASEKVKSDRQLANTALLWLADKLEGKDVPDLDI